MKKAFLIFISVFSLVLILGIITPGNFLNAKEAQAADSTTPKFQIPELSIQIPGMATFTQGTCVTDAGGQTECTVNWIGEYISGIYNYALGVAGILAVIVLMMGGIIWLVSGGDMTKITQSKELIIGSITGLVLLLCSYVLLYQINPDLTKFKALTLGYVDEIVVEGDTNAPITLDSNINKKFEEAGIKCGKDSVAEIVNKTKGKVTYSQPNRGKISSDGTMYFDCSSYASYVLKCAGLSSSIPNYTGSIFADKSEFSGSLYDLKAGDLIGWPPAKGHVMIYLGDSQFGDCNAGSGKESGKAIGIHSLQQLQKAADKYSGGKLYIKRN